MKFQALKAFPLLGLFISIGFSGSAHGFPSVNWDGKDSKNRSSLPVTDIRFPERRELPSNTSDTPLYIGLIGDSLSTNFHVSSLGNMISNLWTGNGGNWFLDADQPNGNVESLAKRVAQYTHRPVIADNYASPAAYIDGANHRQGLADWAGNVYNLSQQVDFVLTNDRLPDILLIWIGHTNINWAKNATPDQLKDPEPILNQIAFESVESYAKQLRRLVRAGKERNHPFVIVVFGLVNFQAFFQAREAIENSRRPGSYPYLERDLEIFKSLRPEYRENMIRLADMINAQLKQTVSTLGEDNVIYSDSFAEADLSDPKLLSEQDGWHPSKAGHNLLAEKAFEYLKPIIDGSTVKQLLQQKVVPVIPFPQIGIIP